MIKKGDNLKSEKGRKQPVFKNYIKAMKKLLDANKELEKRGLWLSLYTWRAMSGLMFLRTPYGATWSVQKYIEDVRRMGEYAWAEAVWHVPVEAIEQMQRKLELPISDVQMNGFSLLIQVWFYEQTIRFMKHDKCRFPRVNHGGRYDALQLVEGIKEFEVIPVLCPQQEEMVVPTVRAFMKTDGFRDYILDGEGVLSYEEQLERAREELRAEKGKHSHANELEARLKMCAAPSEAQDIRHQLGGDVGVHSNSGLESLARAVTDLREATAYDFGAVKGREEDVTCQTTAHIWVLLVTFRTFQRGLLMLLALLMVVMIEPHVQPSTEVEDVGEKLVDVADMPCGEAEQQQLEPVVGNLMYCPSLMLGRKQRIKMVWSCRRRGHDTRIATNVEDCTPGTTEGMDYKAMLDPRMQSMDHARPMAVDSMAADDEACRVTIPEEDAQITVETERTSPDTDDVGCGDDGGGKSSNIVTCMRRKARC
ncbi:LOW QUALITY PROTEIN: hypothetical protein Cgig2_011318 [Carnegiea gigantea]|uniref:Aminotransferase-like plant mobile domain-containing protein n=1 Tax=Carnegiea gigantea TaxID=171969 RepID=A0A9Q1GRN2_9CARY|nr:LOW QUALITY PROTEIN: hypothetical protein Cgig2_011318 [Carnegiea gigantea]